VFRVLKDNGVGQVIRFLLTHNVRQTGIFVLFPCPDECREIKEWEEKQIGSASAQKTELADIKLEIALLRQTVDLMHKKIDNIGRMLEKVSD
jgi:hypothetical protein